jgi:hypothetical protein
MKMYSLVLSRTLAKLNYILRPNSKVSPRLDLLTIQHCPIRRIQIEKIGSNNLRHVAEFVLHGNLSELNHCMLFTARSMIHR